MLQKLIREGLVSSDDGPVTVPRYPVKANMRITVLLPEEESPEPEPEPFEFPILYEDDAMLVIAKPAGVVVHPAVGNRSGTVVNALLGRYPQLAEELACGSSRPGIVHRLDKDTSGCLAVARPPPRSSGSAVRLRAGRPGKPTLPWSAAHRRGLPANCPD